MVHSVTYQSILSPKGSFLSCHESNQHPMNQLNKASLLSRAQLCLQVHLRAVCNRKNHRQVFPNSQREPSTQTYQRQVPDSSFRNYGKKVTKVPFRREDSYVLRHSSLWNGQVQINLQSGPTERDQAQERIVPMLTLEAILQQGYIENLPKVEMNIDWSA